MRLAPMCDCLAAPAHLVARALPYRWGRAGPKLVAFAGEVPQIGRKGNEIWNVLSRPPSQGEKPQLVWSRNVRILTLSIFSLPFRPICGMRVPSSRLVPSFSTHRTHRRRVLLQKRRLLLRRPCQPHSYGRDARCRLFERVGECHRCITRVSMGVTTKTIPSRMSWSPTRTLAGLVNLSTRRFTQRAASYSIKTIPVVYRDTA